MPNAEQDHHEDSRRLLQRVHDATVDEINPDTIAGLRDELTGHFDDCSAKIVSFYRVLKVRGLPLTGEKWDAFVEIAEAEEQRRAATREAGQVAWHDHWFTICQLWSPTVADHYNWGDLKQTKMKILQQCAVRFTFKEFVHLYNLVMFLEHRQAVTRPSSRRKRFIGPPGEFRVESVKVLSELTDTKKAVCGELINVASAAEWAEEIQGWVATEDGSLPVKGRRLDYWRPSDYGKYFLQFDKYGMLMARQFDVPRRASTPDETGIVSPPTSVRRSYLRGQGEVESPPSDEEDAVESGTPTPVNDSDRLAKDTDGFAAVEFLYGEERHTPSIHVHGLSSGSTLFGSTPSTASVVPSAATFRRWPSSVESEDSGGSLFVAQDDADGEMSGIDMAENEEAGNAQVDAASSGDGAAEDVISGKLVGEDISGNKVSDGSTSSSHEAEGGAVLEAIAEDDGFANDEVNGGTLEEEVAHHEHVAQGVGRRGVSGDETADLADPTDAAAQERSSTDKLVGEEMSEDELADEGSEDGFDTVPDDGVHEVSEDGADGLLGGVNGEASQNGDGEMRDENEEVVEEESEEMMECEHEEAHESGDVFNDRTVAGVSGDCVVDDWVHVGVEGNKTWTTTKEGLSAEETVAGDLSRASELHPSRNTDQQYDFVNGDESAAASFREVGGGWTGFLSSYSGMSGSASTTPSPDTPRPASDYPVEDGYSSAWPTASTNVAYEESFGAAWPVLATARSASTRESSQFPQRTGQSDLLWYPGREFEPRMAPHLRSTASADTPAARRTDLGSVVARTQVHDQQPRNLPDACTEHVAASGPPDHIAPRAPAPQIGPCGPVPRTAACSPTRHTDDVGWLTRAKPAALTATWPMPDSERSIEERSNRRYYPEIQRLVKTAQSEAAAPGASPLCVARWRWLSDATFATTSTPWESSLHRGTPSLDADADVYHCSDLAFIQVAQKGGRLTKPVVIKEKSSDIHLHSIESLVIGLRDAYGATSLTVRRVHADEPEELPMSDFLDFISSDEKAVTPLDFYDKFRAHQPLPELLTRFMSLGSAMARARVNAGGGTMPMFSDSQTLSLSRIETDGAFAGPHIGSLGMWWNRDLVGTRLVMVVPRESMAGEWEAFAREGPQWQPRGKQLLIPLEPGDLLILPEFSVFASCAMGTCASTEGPLWDSRDVIASLQSARWAEENPACATGVLMHQLPGVPRGLEELVRQDLGRYAGEEPREQFLMRLREMISALDGASGEYAETREMLNPDANSLAMDGEARPAGLDTGVGHRLDKRPRIC